MSRVASQTTSLASVYSTVFSGADQGKHQSSASLAFVWGIDRWPVNFPHKWPVTRKMFPFDDVIIFWEIRFQDECWRDNKYCKRFQFAVSKWLRRLTVKGVPIIMIRRYHDCIIFMIEIPYPENGLCFEIQICMKCIKDMLQVFKPREHLCIQRAYFVHPTAYSISDIFQVWNGWE